MPFRSNFFGDKYAQPGTAAGEIDDLLVEKYGDAPTIYGATIDDGDDDAFKWGGRISFNSLEDDEIEDLVFDGFETKEAARRWLIDEMDIDEASIEEDAG